VNFRAIAHSRKHTVPAVYLLLIITWSCYAWWGHQRAEISQAAADAIKPHIGAKLSQFEAAIKPVAIRTFDVERQYLRDESLHERRYILQKPSALYAWAEYEPESRTVREAGLIYFGSEEVDLDQAADLPFTRTRLHIVVPALASGILLWYLSYRLPSRTRLDHLITISWRALIAVCAVLTLLLSGIAIFHWTFAWTFG
jgi:hypothetical protein